MDTNLEPDTFDTSDRAASSVRVAEVEWVPVTGVQGQLRMRALAALLMSHADDYDEGKAT